MKDLNFNIGSNSERLEGAAIAIKYLKKILDDTYNNIGSNIDNYIIDNELSTSEIKIYHDDDKKEVVIAPRGTANLKDVSTDIKLIFGYKDNRFKSTKNKLDDVKKKYPDYKIDMAGHSLAGKLVSEIGTNDPAVKNIYTLNKPTTPYDVLFNRKKNDKEIDIRSKKDIVSILSPLDNNKNDINIDPISSNPLTEHKINILDRLNEDLIIGSGIDKLKIKELKAILKFIRKNDKTNNILITGKKKKELIILLTQILS